MIELKQVYATIAGLLNFWQLNKLLSTVQSVSNMHKLR